MRIGYLILFIWISNFCFGQLPENKDFSPEFKDEFLNSKWMDSTEYIDSISKYDFSNILNTWHHNHALGYIGTHYQKFDIRFISIIKDSDTPLTYYVYGKSRVKNNIVDFQGTIKLISAKKYKEQYFNDSIMGSTLGKYVFYENPNQNHVGKFKGYFTSYWLLDKVKKSLSFDDTSAGADGFCNNQFVGTWTPYGANSFKTCNWGEWRIPYSDELDNGAGIFSPVSKFDKHGWKDYMSSVMYKLKYKKEKPLEEWWK